MTDRKILDVRSGRWARFEEHGSTAAGGVVLRLRREQGDGAATGTVLDRMRLAADWALALDAQYADLLADGRNPQVTVPPFGAGVAGRVQRTTTEPYRRLQMSVGALIRPALLEPPRLDDLYPFQRTGAMWLADRTEAILADDMGLGKTVQAISALRLVFNRGQARTALVICPKSLIATWERECARWAPELGVAALVPPARIREEVWGSVAGRRHVLLTNYEQLRSLPGSLERDPPDIVIADEAHRLRNHDAQVTLGCFELRPKRFWALTGTPLERDAVDLATLLSLVAPKRFAPTDAKALHPSALRAHARSYALRRRKADVLDDLPDVLDTTETLELTPAQAKAQRATIREHRRRGAAGDELALVTRLMALCDIDPETGASSKLDRILYTLGRIRDEGEKAVVFSQRLAVLRELKRRVEKRWGPEAAELLVGDMDAEAREQAVARFRGRAHCLALLASSKVGGEGLTLIEANHVFLINQWWNPSANEQARDRVVRIGQRRKVRVYRFCCRGTVEERLERVLKSKRVLVNEVVEGLATGDDGAWKAVVRDVGVDKLLPAETTE